MRILMILLCVVTGALLCSCAGQHLRYTPDELKAVRARPNLTELKFTTKKGSQGAFYFGPKTLPDHVVLMFPGIGSRALDRLDWADAFSGDTVGFLLIDYPGRGVCEGAMRPSELPLTTTGALQELQKALNTDRDALMSRLRVAAHSFGTGAALQFLAETPVDRIVLLSPFTTMKKALFRQMGPIAWLIPDNLDSRENLRTLYAKRPDAKVMIVHGALDETIPVAMGRTLNEISGGRAMFEPIVDGDHVSVLTRQAPMVFRFLLQE